jgi:hypothetical protein
VAQPHSLRRDGEGRHDHAVDVAFWQAPPIDAAGSYSSSVGRRVLVAKIQQRLAKISFQ